LLVIQLRTKQAAIMNRKFSLGAKLRSIRDERGFSQRELAQKAGVSTNAVSLIERDENSPSVSTLQALAGALGVKMSFFFEDDGPQSVLHVKRGTRPTVEGKGVRVEGIGGELSRQELEPFLISLEPRSGSGDRQVVHTGHEFVYCLAGQVEYIIDGEVYKVEAGDFLLFEAHLPHIWRNTSDSGTQFLLVLQTPGQSPEPVQRHFPGHPSITYLGQTR
jgi:transcriptional regulator with XRE-family HTH domain